MSGALNGPKATVKALTEKLYWVPGIRLDSTVMVVLSIVLMLKTLPEDDHCSS